MRDIYFECLTEKEDSLCTDFCDPVECYPYGNCGPDCSPYDEREPDPEPEPEPDPESDSDSDSEEN